jgi:hypothetical protein
MKMFRLKCLVLAFVVGFLLPLPARAAEDLTDLLVQKGTITKEEADSLQKRGIATFIDKITLYGDLRLREESMWYGGGNDNNGTAKEVDTNRQRFRLRIGMDIQEGKTFVHIRVASGSGQQVSTNQTMQNNSSGKAIFIDKAYVELKQIPNLNVMGGKMTNPFFVNWLSGEMVFDDDYNPEGFSQQYSLKLGDNQKVFVNLGQIILDGGSGSNQSQWLLGEQVGTEMKMDPVNFNAALLFYSLANGEKSNFSSVIVQDGNTRKGAACTTTVPSGNPCILANPFSVIDGTVGVSFNAGLPITISGDYVKNLQDTVEQTSPNSIKNQDTAMGIGFKIGNASAANTYEFAYTYRSIESDATLADINDSDFGPNGGTNRKGHSVWVAYNPTNSTQVKLKYINSKMIKEELKTTSAPGSGTNPNPPFNRVQLDFSVKF